MNKNNNNYKNKNNEKNKNNKPIDSILNNNPAVINDDGVYSEAVSTELKVEKSEQADVLKQDNIDETSKPFFVKKMPEIVINESEYANVEIQNFEDLEIKLNKNEARKKELNKKWFEITSRQFKILCENSKLTTKIFETDWEYSSEFDEFVASIIGKKSRPFAMKIKQNENEYSENEKELKRIEQELSNL
ncbi:MAG: hypothetical protein QMC67_10230 [Candidatus Wallbacteria bacterium]